MHIFFSGIGGTAIGPLAMIAKQAGYKVSGSDEKPSQYTEYLSKNGVGSFHIGQSREAIAKLHSSEPVDWFVYSSALPANHPELAFCTEAGIKTSKRDELLNKIITEKNLKLLAVAGTHGKTTTTAMAVWLFKQLGLPVSYSVGAKISFGEMGEFNPQSNYFIYECDEFDRNFLAFKPYISMISGVAYDHHEVFASQEDYNSAFRQFLNQSKWKVLWQKDFDKLSLQTSKSVMILDENDGLINNLSLKGVYNRRDAFLVAKSLHEILDVDLEKIIAVLNDFPGLSRRFEKIAENLYTDYAHTPEKIVAALDVAKENLSPNQKLVIIYEPLTNRRMHHTKSQHRNLFKSADTLYWVPSYLAREDASLEILSPAQLVSELDPGIKAIANASEMNQQLESKIKSHLKAGDMVLALSGGGGNSLDEWLRQHLRFLE